MADPVLHSPIAQADRILENMHRTLQESKTDGEGTRWTKFRDQVDNMVQAKRARSENAVEEGKSERNVAKLEELKAQVEELGKLLESVPDKKTAREIYDKISFMLNEIVIIRRFFTEIYGERTTKENPLALIGNIFSFGTYSYCNDLLNKPALVHLDNATDQLKKIQGACDLRLFLNIDKILEKMSETLLEGQAYGREEERKGGKNTERLQDLEPLVEELEKLLVSVTERERVLEVYNEISFVLREIEGVRHFIAYTYKNASQEELPPELQLLDNTTEKLKKIQKACNERFFGIVESEEVKKAEVIEGYRVGWIEEADQLPLQVTLEGKLYAFHISNVYLRDCLRTTVYFNNRKINVLYKITDPSDKTQQREYAKELIQDLYDMGFTAGQIQNYLHTATQRLCIEAKQKLEVALLNKYGGEKKDRNGREFNLTYTTQFVTANLFIHSAFDFDAQQYTELSLRYEGRFGLHALVNGDLIEQPWGIGTATGVVDLLAPKSIPESERGAFSQEAKARKAYSKLIDGGHHIEWKFFKDSWIVSSI